MRRLNNDDPAPQEPDFLDNLVNAILNRVLGTEQLWEKLGLPRGPTAKTKEQLEEAIKASRPTEGWGGVLGDIIATAPLMAMPGGPVVSGTAAGAITGLTEPVRGGGDYLEEKAIQTGIGAAVGFGTGTLGKLFGSFAHHAPDRFNREALQAAAPPGMAEKITKIGHEGMKQLKKLWNSAWDDVTPGLKANIDDGVELALANIRSGMRAQGFTDDQIQRFWNVVQGQIIEPAARGETGAAGVLTGEAAQRVQSSLRTIANSQADIEAPVMAAREVVLDAIARGSAPDVAREFALLRRNYPAFIAVEDATAMASASEPRGLFNPTQLAQAARRLDTTTHRAATAGGLAPLQELISEGLEQRIGRYSGVTEILSPTWFGGISRMAERSPVVRGVGQAIEEATVPATVGGASQITRSASGLPAPGEWTEGGFPARRDETDADIERFLMEEEDEEPSGGVKFLRESDEELEQFFAPAIRESDIDRIHGAIIEQESGGQHYRRGKVITSPSGAVGIGQIMPSTFRDYARPNESIWNERDNLAVSRRIISEAYDKYGGDPRAVAARYFSGSPNYRALTSDVTGKKTASYVSDVMKRLGRTA